MTVCVFVSVTPWQSVTFPPLLGPPFRHKTRAARASVAAEARPSPILIDRRRILQNVGIGNQPIMAEERPQSPVTLGEVLYAKSKAPVSEQGG